MLERLAQLLNAEVFDFRDADEIAPTASSAAF
jgi:hypothetical protein